jgi:uncharacterized protein (TIGR03067 family)
MKWRSLAVVAICSLCGLTGAAQDRPKTDRQLVQGIWDWDPDVKQQDLRPQVALERVVIKGDTLTFHYNLDGKKFTSATTFKLNATASPREIDFIPTEGSNKGKTYRGLYEVKAGRLRICYRGPGSSRPKDFDDKRDPKINRGTMFIVLKRSPAG